MQDKDPIYSRSARPPAFGDGVFRERRAQPHSWSNDWPFVERRRTRGPSETFAKEGQWRAPQKVPVDADGLNR